MVEQNNFSITSFLTFVNLHQQMLGKEKKQTN